MNIDSDFILLFYISVVSLTTKLERFCPNFDILLRCQNNDLTAFRQVVEMPQSFAYSLALRMLCDTKDVRDVTNLCLDYLKARAHSRRL